MQDLKKFLEFLSISNPASAPCPHPRPRQQCESLPAARFSHFSIALACAAADWRKASRVARHANRSAPRVVLALCSGCVLWRQQTVVVVWGQKGNRHGTVFSGRWLVRGDGRELVLALQRWEVGHTVDPLAELLFKGVFLQICELCCGAT